LPAGACFGTVDAEGDVEGEDAFEVDIVFLSGSFSIFILSILVTYLLYIQDKLFSLVSQPL
jgi:hypothetical protein